MSNPRETKGYIPSPVERFQQRAKKTIVKIGKDGLHWSNGIDTVERNLERIKGLEEIVKWQPTPQKGSAGDGVVGEYTKKISRPVHQQVKV